ncbi:MAG: XrtA/PEP-CTERM system exopolysaccharide export protein [Magnetospiraceae bacterium]
MAMMLVAGIFGLSACTTGADLPDAATVAPSEIPEVPIYRIGANDVLEIFVWRNNDLSTSVQVRPDGKISVPLIEDLQAAGRTPTQLARDIEAVLATYIQDPIVTIIVGSFVGPFDQQVRVVGEASKPRAIAYREHMTVLDIMIASGGLTDFAAGNEAVLVRRTVDGQKNYRVRLDDLLRNGDVTANAPVLPGDILIIPQTWF